MSGRDLIHETMLGAALADLSESGGVVVAELVALDDGCDPFVMRHGVVVRARSAVDLHADHIGQGVLVVFEAGKLELPIVTGVLRTPRTSGACRDHLEVESDGERIVVQAQQQLVLRCGKASITLTRAGKVLINGAYVLSRSSGVNRVKGGSVQLN